MIALAEVQPYPTTDRSFGNNAAVRVISGAMAFRSSGVTSARAGMRVCSRFRSWRASVPRTSHSSVSSVDSTIRPSRLPCPAPRSSSYFISPPMGG
jgi:hypothetical protein